MLWTPLQSGRYENLILPEAVLRDPNWFFRSYEEGKFESGDLGSIDAFLIEGQARQIQRQARHIKLPQNDLEQYEVEYIFDLNGKLEHMTVANAKRNRPADPSSIFRKHIDLGVPYEIGKNDRNGGQIVINFFKNYVFYDKEITLTAETCEEFFDADDNFDLGQTIKPKGLIF